MADHLRTEMCVDHQNSLSNSHWIICIIMLTITIPGICVCHFPREKSIVLALVIFNLYYHNPLFSAIHLWIIIFELFLHDPPKKSFFSSSTINMFIIPFKFIIYFPPLPFTVKQWKSVSLYVWSLYHSELFNFLSTFMNFRCLKSKIHESIVGSWMYR